MRIFGPHHRNDGVGVAEVTQTGLLRLRNHKWHRGGCPRGSSIDEAIQVKELDPVEIVSHVIFASVLLEPSGRRSAEPICS